MIEDFTASLEKLYDNVAHIPAAIVEFLPNIVAAILMLIAAYFLSRWVKRLSRKVFGRFKFSPEISMLLSRIAGTAIVVVMLLLVLGVLNLDKVLTSILAGAGIAGLVIGMAFQGPISNTISGIVLSTRSKYNLGDLIKSNDHFGEIKEITLRSTTLRMLSGEQVVIPNKLVLDAPLVNYTFNRTRRIEIKCGVGYGSDLKKVREIAHGVAQHSVEHADDLPVEFYYTEFGDSSINFVLRFWIRKTDQATFLKTKSDAIIELKAAFDEENINIPFPIRTLDFKDPNRPIQLAMTGNQGGEKSEKQSSEENQEAKNASKNKETDNKPSEDSETSDDKN